MKEIGKKLWHDPVWSKVIAGSILGAMTVVGGLWSKSDFSPNFAIAWIAARGLLREIWAWLVSPADISVCLFIFLLCLVVAREIGGIIARRKRDMLHYREVNVLSQQNSDLRAAIARAEVEQTAKEMEDRMAAAEAEAKAKMRTLRKPIESLDDDSVKLLRYLLRRYPQVVSVDSLSNFLGRSYAVTEQLLEGLAAQRFIKHMDAPYAGNNGWGLTKLGRDFCLTLANYASDKNTRPNDPY